MLCDVYGSRVGLLVECPYPAAVRSGKSRASVTGHHVLLLGVDLRAP
ncbi:hypothetical protein [Yinghuangia aomiensis]